MTSRDTIEVEGTDRVFRRSRIMFVMLVPLAMALMAISSVNVALPVIETALDASSAQIQWVISGYALAFGVVLVPGGRMGDVLGRGTMFVVGVAIFALGSLGAGLAPNPDVLNLSRVVMGVGAGLNSPQITGMIQQYYQGQERARAFALFGMVISASVAAGPLLTGTIIQIFGPELGWRVSFLVIVLAGVLSVWSALAWLPFSQERERAALRAAGVGERAPVDLDPVGAVLLVVAVLCVMLPFMLKTWWGWFLIPGAAVLLPAWVAWERSYLRRGHAPMVDLRLFQYRNFTRQVAISGTMFIGTTSVFVVLAFYLMGELGASALDAALITLPESILSGVFAMWAGRHALRRGRDLVILALAGFIVSVLLMIVTAWIIEITGVSYWWMIVPLTIMAFGHGAMGSANQTIAVVDIPASEGGVAGGVKQTAERVGNALGNAMITAIYFAGVTHGPAVGVTVGYSAIVFFCLISLAIAVVDRRQQGPGIVEAVGA